MSHDPSHDLSSERISRSIPRTDLRGRRRRRCSSKKDQSYDLSTGIHTSDIAIRQHSTVQRRMPPRKLERENPSEFRSRLESKPGSNCGATSNYGGQGASGTCVSPPPLRSPYIGGQGGQGGWCAGLGGGESNLDSKPPRTFH